MKHSIKLILGAVLVIQLGFVSPCRAAESVIVNPKFKQDTVSAPDPEFPIKARNMGHAGQGVYRLIVNEKTGMVDEVQIMKRAGASELDASAVTTLFKWKFRAGTVKRRDVSVIFELAGRARDLH